jgi:hypothetical protein
MDGLMEGTFNTTSLIITPEMLYIIAELDEFKGAGRGLSTLAPERLSALRRVAAIESIGASTWYSLPCRRARLVTHAERRHEALHYSVRLVASGLRRVAAICNVLQSWREKSFNLLRVLTCGRELLICGLWVRFPPGSPEILTKTSNREIQPQVETLSETLTRQNRVKLRRGVG